MKSVTNIKTIQQEFNTTNIFKILALQHSSLSSFATLKKTVNKLINRSTENQMSVS